MQKLSPQSLILPRGLGRIAAAAYVGISPSKFDQLVHERRMPPPRRIDARKIWDRLELDAAFEELPNEGRPPSEANDWE